MHANGNVTVSGGTIRIDAGGDGIDSNGDLNVSGGETYVSGPTSDGDSALDYDGAATVTGGTIVAAGYSGMAQNFGSDSTRAAPTPSPWAARAPTSRSSASSTAAAVWVRPRTAAKAAAPGNKSALFLPPK